MKKLAVFASGNGSNYEAIAAACADGRIDAEVVLLVCDNPCAYVLRRTEKFGTPTLVFNPRDYKCKAEFERPIADKMDALGVDLVCLAGYMRIIGDVLLKRYGGRIINIHPSLIPSFCGPGYYGLKVHEGVLNRGVKVTGATVHFVDEGIDTGRIIAQKAVEVCDGDTPSVLQRRVMEQAEWHILPETIGKIAQGIIKIGE